MPRACILLADDDAQIRHLVGITLASDDFQLCYAEDGPSAVRMARELQPELLLLDYQMPGTSGAEVCRALRDNPDTSTIRIVMLTGVGGRALREQAFEAGVDDFLTKPFSPIALEQKVRATLALARVSRAETAVDSDPFSATNTLHPGPGPGLSRDQLMMYATDLNQSMRQLRHAHVELRRSYLATVEALATALELRDANTEGHCQRVTLYTIAAARHMGIGDEALEQIHWGAVLHDVGKIGVPDSILLKPTSLLPEEWEVMKRHPDLGYQMLEAIPFLTGALSIVRFHHERFDGGGYPLGLSGADIPLGARLFAVADKLDAITVDRPYRPARTWDEARAEVVRCTGTQFDPAIVDAYLEILDDLSSLDRREAA